MQRTHLKLALTKLKWNRIRIVCKDKTVKLKLKLIKNNFHKLNQSKKRKKKLKLNHN